MNEYKNRVLSLAELAVSAGTLVWIEDNNGDDETWRCWARKPTPEEMEATPWEVKHNEH